MLVILDDGFTIKATTVDAAGQSGTVAVASEVELAAALKEIKSSFKGVRDVVVVTREAVVGSIEFPPGAAETLGFNERNQLAQFELMTKMPQNDTMIGELLVGRSVITHAQLHELLTEQRESRKDRSAGNYQHLGALAVSKGFATQEQIDKAIDVQRRINEPKIGYSPLAGVGPELKASYGMPAGTEVGFMYQEVRDQWLAALKQAGFRLGAILPLAGITRHYFGKQFTSGNLVELYDHGINIVALDGSGAVESIPFGGKPMDVEQLSNLLSRVGSTQKYIWAATNELRELVLATGEHTNKDSQLLDDPNESVQILGISTVNAINAMRHVVFPLKNPPKPLREQPFIPWVYAVMLAAIVVFVAENHIKKEIQPLVNDLEAERVEHQEWEDNWAEATEFLDKIGILEDGIKKNQELIATANAGIQLIGNLKNRSGFQVKLMETLMESISEGVIIDSLESTSGDAFAVKLWAITPQQGTAFVEVFSEKLSLMNLTVEVLSTRSGQGDVGVDGTEMIVSINPQIEDAPASVEELEDAE
ncbi:MAG: hypothetical protein VX876_07015 [Planctomycetota bacterium]|nr:hypothetical protein [Planctomycetota bacterium]